MTFDDIVMQIAQQLKERYDDPVLQQQAAWWLIEALTGERKEHLVSQKTFGLTDEQEQTLKKSIALLVEKRMPLQYLLGFVPFGDIEIVVRPPILIPRPETEEWVYGLIEQLQTLKNQELTILDLCTGSGCIALALADALPTAHVYGTDISKEALELACENSHHNGLINATFLESDLFDNIPAYLKFDLIIANPPYIEESEYKTLDQSVLDWEDKAALVADQKGFGIIQKIIEQAPDYLKPNEELEQKKIQNLWIEIGYAQGDESKELLKKRGYSNIAVQKDLATKDRVAKGSYAP